MAGITPGQQIGINAASSAIGGVIGLAGAALQHKYNKDLAQFQYDKNLEMWEKQNTYNSPIEQRKRLEEAGLNPALMYGNGSVSTGNASQMPQYQQMGVDLSSNMLSAMQMAQMAANIRNTNADTEGKKIDNKTKDEMNRAIIDNYLKDLDVKDSQININVKTLSKMDVDISKANKEIEDLNATIALKAAQTSSETERKALYAAQTALTILQQSTEKSKKENLDANTATARAQKDVYQATEKSINAKTWYDEWRNNIIEQTGADPTAPMEQMVFQVLSKVFGYQETETDEYGLTPSERARDERKAGRIEEANRRAEHRREVRRNRQSGDKSWYLGTDRLEGMITDGID